MQGKNQTRGGLSVVAVGLMVLLVGCGGGGNDSAGSPGPGPVLPPSPSLAVEPANVEATADAETSTSTYAYVTVTIRNPTTPTVYVGGQFTDTGIAEVALQQTGSGLRLAILFKDARTLGSGRYEDVVELAICADSTCATEQPGTRISIPVVYTVYDSTRVTLSANPTTVGVGLSTTLTWSATHAAGCVASGAWSGDLPSSGSRAVTPGGLGSHVYTLRCGDPGVPEEVSVTVTATAPTVALTVFPSKVQVGHPVTLRWSSPYAASCSGTGAWSGPLPISGAKTLTPSTLGLATFHITCSTGAASAISQAETEVVPVVAAPPATTYRMNERHDGVLITTNGIQRPAGAAPTWTRDLGAPVSYPLIAEGRVYVTTANPNGSYGNRLYALDGQTGAILWGPVAVSGVYFGSGLTYDQGRVFVMMFDGGVRAFDASNGAALWSAQIPGQWFNGFPNAYDGKVYLAGGGGLLALDQANGAIVWNATAAGTTDWVSPAVASEGVFMMEGYSCRSSANDPVFGTPLWQTTNGCSQPWGLTPVVKNGILFGRTMSSINLFDTATGKFQIQLGSERAPAITETALIALNAGTLSSTRLSDRVQTWTFGGDGGLVTAPVVVNDTVFVGSTTGKVYGLSAATGAQVWVGASPLPINPDSERGGPQPPYGPAAGEDLLIFTAGTTVLAWKLQ